MIQKSDVALVVRSASERTTNLSEQLLQNIFPENEVHVLQVMPFSKAVEDSLAYGIASRKKWLLCLDADVLVSVEGVNRLLDIAEHVDTKVFVIKNLILDKFFPIYRASGIHLYRTAIADIGIKNIPAEGTTLRPETTMIKAMFKEGYKYFQSDAIVGIHDYEQSYSDIYRKCFLQAHKHSKLIPVVEHYWSWQSQNDFDFQVAIWGALAGKLYSNTVYVDKEFLDKEAIEFLSIKGIMEKTALLQDEYDAEYVSTVLKSYNPENFIELQGRMFPKTGWNIEYPLPLSPPPSMYRKAIYKLGTYFSRTGEFLKNHANTK